MKIYDPNDPMMGPSSAVKTVVIRANKLLENVNEPRKTDLILAHVRRMHLEAFGVFWESHAIEILDHISEIRFDDPEAREIFLIAVKHYLSPEVKW